MRNCVRVARQTLTLFVWVQILVPQPIDAPAAQRGHRYRGVAQFGRALRSGRRGREFESRHLDHRSILWDTPIFLSLHLKYFWFCCTEMCNFCCLGTCMQKDLFLTTYRRAKYSRRKLQLPNQSILASQPVSRQRKTGKPHYSQIPALSR